jgi:hypothetical protein
MDLFAASVSSADPPPSSDQTLAEMTAEMEQQRLRADPSDRPMVLGSDGPSEAGGLSSVSVDCGQAPPRILDGRPHVRCRVTETSIRQADPGPVEDEIGGLGVVAGLPAKAFDEACNYLAGKPLRSESDPASYQSESKMWSHALAERVDEARRQTTEGQRAFLAGVVQACQARDKERFVRTYITFLREVEERTCRLEAWGETDDFEKVDVDTWVARPPPHACGETLVVTLFRAPGSRLAWNYKYTETYPAPPPPGAPAMACASMAGKTYAHEFLWSNRRLREPGCRYFEL